jgi:hypothetical protein
VPSHNSQPLKRVRGLAVGAAEPLLDSGPAHASAAPLGAGEICPSILGLVLLSLLVLAALHCENDLPWCAAECPVGLWAGVRKLAVFLLSTCGLHGSETFICLLACLLAYACRDVCCVEGVRLFFHGDDGLMIS